MGRTRLLACALIVEDLADGAGSAARRPPTAAAEGAGRRRGPRSRRRPRGGEGVATGPRHPSRETRSAHGRPGPVVAASTGCARVRRSRGRDRDVEPPSSDARGRQRSRRVGRRRRRVEVAVRQVAPEASPRGGAGASGVGGRESCRRPGKARRRQARAARRAMRWQSPAKRLRPPVAPRTRGRGRGRRGPADRSEDRRAWRRVALTARSRLKTAAQVGRGGRLHRGGMLRDAADSARGPGDHVRLVATTAVRPIGGRNDGGVVAGRWAGGGRHVVGVSTACRQTTRGPTVYLRRRAARGAPGSSCVGECHARELRAWGGCAWLGSIASAPPRGGQDRGRPEWRREDAPPRGGGDGGPPARRRAADPPLGGQDEG